MKGRVKFLIWLVVCIGLVAAGITNMVISHNDSFLSAMVILGGVVVSLIVWIDSKSDVAAAISILCFCIAFFSLSGAVWGKSIKGNLVVVERENRISIYSGGLPEVTRPFSGVKVYQLSETFDIKTDGVIQTDKGSVHWKVSANFTRAEYDEFFSLIRKAGGFNEWMTEVKGAFQEVIAQRMSQFSPDQVLPSHFSFFFTVEQAQKMTALGATPNGEITAEGMEVWTAK